MIKPIINTLNELKDGELMTDFSEQFNTLLKQIDVAQKQGTISLKLTVKPASVESMVTVVPTITVAPPKIDFATLFYQSEDHNLSKNNPEQNTETVLKSVPADVMGKLKTIND